ncbi:MAG: histidine--tRNA ligase [Pseudomonadota bacterium]|nr:histidine--tRNA ligase [Pseudomonadota bacterium]
MKNNISSVRGMHDILPEESGKWKKLEHILAKLALRFGYNELRTPILENTKLFQRSIGQETDIVNKEMYSFDDRNGDSITLRPEGTASCVRALLQAGLLRSPGQKVWYLGPMFRYERPQKGRTRQFHQFGMEVYGIANVNVELELLSYCDILWQNLGLKNKLKLEINCLGSSDCRTRYKTDLVKFFLEHKKELSPAEVQRLENNPLRLLDSKNPIIKELLKDAPQLVSYICAEETSHFNLLKKGLDNLNIRYEVNPFLVRGLDYYNGTVFEWTTTELGAQGTVCAGGRYDKLVAKLSNNVETPAFGFALGMERLLEISNLIGQAQNGIYIITTDISMRDYANVIAHEIREKFDVTCQLDHQESNIKTKLKKAVTNNALIAIIIGGTEIEMNCVTLKNLKQQKQEQVSRTDLISHLNTIFGDKYESI